MRETADDSPVRIRDLGSTNGTFVNGCRITADTLEDGDEVNTYNTDPVKQDTDGDWLKDNFEVLLLNTNPNSGDTDADTLPDFWEAIHFVGPNDPASVSGNPDGDAYTNLQEYQNNTDPRSFDP